MQSWWWPLWTGFTVYVMIPQLWTSMHHLEHGRRCSRGRRLLHGREDERHLREGLAEGTGRHAEHRHPLQVRHLVVWCHLGSGGRAVVRRSVNRGDGGSIPPTAVSKLTQFRLPHICLWFSEDTKSRWSLLSGVYARGSKRSPTGVTCSGLTNSREGQLLR